MSFKCLTIMKSKTHLLVSEVTNLWYLIVKKKKLASAAKSRVKMGAAGRVPCQNPLKL